MSNVVHFKTVQNRTDRSRDLPSSPVNEAEMRFFWRCMRELRTAVSAGDFTSLREWFDEIETLAAHTENATLRKMCQPYLLPN